MQDDYINEVKAKCILNRVVKSTVLASFPIKITSGKQTDSTIFLGKPPPTRGCNSKCLTFHKAGIFRLFLKYAFNQPFILLHVFLIERHTIQKKSLTNLKHGGTFWLAYADRPQVGDRTAVGKGCFDGLQGSYRLFHVPIYCPGKGGHCPANPAPGEMVGKLGVYGRQQV